MRALPINTLLLTSITLALAGIATTPATALVGGRELSDDEIPAAFALVAVDSRWGCGGSLIAQRLVVTAAHCVVGPASGKPLKASRLSVARPGALVSIKTPLQASVAVQKVIVSFATSPKRYGNDLALLRLAAPIPGGAPAPLARVAPAAGAKVSMTAFGPTYVRADLTRALLDNAGRARGARFAVRSAKICERIRSYRKVFERSTMLCVGTPAHGDDTCPGDSGSPAFAGGKTIAVVSFSLASSCQGRRPPGPVVLARPDGEFLELVADEARTAGTDQGASSSLLADPFPRPPAPGGNGLEAGACRTASRSSSPSSGSASGSTTSTSSAFSSSSTTNSSSSTTSSSATSSTCPTETAPEAPSPETPAPKRSAVKIIVSEDKLAEDGWVLEPSGTKFHVTRSCRDAIEQAGMPIGVAPFADINAIRDSSPPACDSILIPARPQGSVVALPREKIAPNQDGWITDGRGRNKSYASAACRRKALADGLLILLTPWAELEAVGDTAAQINCG